MSEMTAWESEASRLNREQARPMARDMLNAPDPPRKSDRLEFTLIAAMMLVVVVGWLAG